MSKEQDTGRAGSLPRAIIESIRKTCTTFPEDFRLELRGQGEMFICGCKKINLYTETEICVSTGELCVRVRGEGLGCASFHCSGLVIEGKILGIELESAQ